MPPVLAALGLGGAAGAGGAAAGGASALAPAAAGAGALANAGAGGGLAALGPAFGGAAPPLLAAMGPNLAGGAAAMPSIWSQLGQYAQHFGQGLGQGMFGGDPSSQMFQLGNKASQSLMQPKQGDQGGEAFTSQYVTSQAQRRQMLLKQMGLL